MAAYWQDFGGGKPVFTGKGMGNIDGVRLGEYSIPFFLPSGDRVYLPVPELLDCMVFIPVLLTSRAYSSI